MCQGVFPSAFNPCDCSSSEFPPYAHPKSKQIKPCSTHPVVAPPGHNQLAGRTRMRINDASAHPHSSSSVPQNLGSFSASSLLAKWVSTPSPLHHHDDATKQDLRRDVRDHGEGMPTSRRVSTSTSSHSGGGAVNQERTQLDTPHLVHAFFFDST